MTPKRKLSAQQKRVIASALADHAGEFLGFDEANRPVVAAMTGIPRQRRTWAITRDGNPTDIKGTVAG